MDWPTWTEVVPLLTVIAALLGAAWAWARLSDRTVSRAVEKAGKESTDATRQATYDLYERLKSNDFTHLEDRIGDGLRGVNARLDRAREDRAALRTDFGGRLERMEARILAAMRQPGAPPPEDSPPTDPLSQRG